MVRPLVCWFSPCCRWSLSLYVLVEQCLYCLVFWPWRTCKMAFDHSSPGLQLWCCWHTVFPLCEIASCIFFLCSLYSVHCLDFLAALYSLTFVLTILLKLFVIQGKLLFLLKIFDGMFSSMAAFSFRLNVSQIVLISIWSFSILSISTHILVISLSILSQLWSTGNGFVVCFYCMLVLWWHQ